jgi:hypothetical protein
MKTVKFGEKASSNKNRDLDSWVQNREIITKEPTKRLTIVIPLSLHTRIKGTCASEDRLMADVIREMLEQRFPSKPIE